jgi:hypothetical protein
MNPSEVGEKVTVTGRQFSGSLYDGIVYVLVWPNLIF